MAQRFTRSGERLSHVLRLFGVFHFFRFPREPVGKNEETRHPEADKNSETFTVGTVVILGAIPSDDRGEDGEEAEEKRKIGCGLEVFLGDVEFVEFFHVRDGDTGCSLRDALRMLIFQSS